MSLMSPMCMCMGYMFPREIILITCLSPFHRVSFRLRVPHSGEPSGWDLLVSPTPPRFGRLQFMGGMAGALIIEGTTDALRDYFEPSRMGSRPPADSGEQRSRFGAGWGSAVYQEFFGLYFTPLFTVNGQVNPTIHMRPGEAQRWRFIHAGMTEHFP